MSIENILNTVKNIKNDIRDAIQEKGVVVAPTAPFDTYDNYIRTINSCEPSQPNVKEWQPDPKWFNIDAILAEDSNAGTEYDYLDDETKYGKTIVLLGVWDSPDSRNWNSIDVNLETPTGGSQHYFNAVKFSDGTFYTTTTKKVITHTFDTTFDKPSSIEGVKTRYAIFYTYLRDFPGFPANSYNRDAYMFSMIIKNTAFSRNDWDNNHTAPSYLKSIKLLGEGYIGHYGSNVNREESYYTQQNVVENFYFERPTHKNTWKLLYEFKDVMYFEWPKRPISGDIYTGLEYNCRGINANGPRVINIENCDFEHCHYNIFNDFNASGRFFKGIIDLSHNKINANKTYYIFNSFTDNSNRMPCTVSIKLPDNANVQLRVRWLSDESLKYLVDNAPELTVQKTLTVGLHVLNKLTMMTPGFEGIYKGKEYSNGIDLLKAKGWTVATGS